MWSLLPNSKANYPRVRDDWEQALVLDPNYQGAYGRLIYDSWFADDDETCQRWIEQSLLRFPNDETLNRVRIQCSPGA